MRDCSASMRGKGGVFTMSTFCEYKEIDSRVSYFVACIGSVCCSGPSSTVVCVLTHLVRLVFLNHARQLESLSIGHVNVEGDFGWVGEGSV